MRRAMRSPRELLIPTRTHVSEARQGGCLAVYRLPRRRQGLFASFSRARVCTCEHNAARTTPDELVTTLDM